MATATARKKISACSNHNNNNISSSNNNSSSSSSNTDNKNIGNKNLNNIKLKIFSFYLRQCTSLGGASKVHLGAPWCPVQRPAVTVSIHSNGMQSRKSQVKERT